VQGGKKKRYAIHLTDIDTINGYNTSMFINSKGSIPIYLKKKEKEKETCHPPDRY
jgi:hypothetical protein